MPRVLPTSLGTTFVASRDRLWEIVTWMPGEADLSAAPSALEDEAPGAASP